MIKINIKLNEIIVIIITSVHTGAIALLCIRIF